MRKNNLIVPIASVLACLLPMIAGAILYNRLPDSIPIHFTVGNVPDNYASKHFVLFGFPIIMAIVQMISIIIVAFTKKDSEIPKLAKLMIWFIPILMAVVYFVIIQYVLGDINVGKVISFVVGILFLAIGNYFPKMTFENNRNSLNPKPKDEKSFRKMIRVAGVGFALFGLFFIILALFL